MAARATLGGQPPAPPASGPAFTDQVNLTDEESRIMRVAGGGSEQSCNAQAVLAAGSMPVVAQDVVQDANETANCVDGAKTLHVAQDAGQGGNPSG